MTAKFSVTEEFTRDIVDLAIKHNKQIKIAYIDKAGNPEQRTVEPIEDKGKNFGAHCLLRGNYRFFSYDRVVKIVLTHFDATAKEEYNAKSS